MENMNRLTMDLRLKLLLDDARLVAVNKPAGLATIPGRGESTSLLQRLADQLGLPCAGETDPRLRVVHRLDKDTSGVVLFAKDIETQRTLSEQFQNNRVVKQYLALVVGRPAESEGEIDAPLAPDPRDRRRMAVQRQGRPARTLWKIEQVFRGLTLLRVYPKTGKTHQIRVHLRSIGLPLAVDPLYNPHAGGVRLSEFKRGYRPARGQEERPLISRLTLHALSLEFLHLDGSEHRVEAPLPRDFDATLRMLQKYAKA